MSKVYSREILEGVFFWFFFFRNIGFNFFSLYIILDSYLIKVANVIKVDH